MWAWLRRVTEKDTVDSPRIYEKLGLLEAQVKALQRNQDLLHRDVQSILEYVNRQKGGKALVWRAAQVIIGSGLVAYAATLIFRAH